MINVKMYIFIQYIISMNDITHYRYYTLVNTFLYITVIKMITMFTCLELILCHYNIYNHGIIIIIIVVVVNTKYLHLNNYIKYFIITIIQSLVIQIKNIDHITTV